MIINSKTWRIKNNENIQNDKFYRFSNVMSFSKWCRKQISSKFSKQQLRKQSIEKTIRTWISNSINKWNSRLWFWFFNDWKSNTTKKFVFLLNRFVLHFRHFQFFFVIYFFRFFSSYHSIRLYSTHRHRNSKFNLISHLRQKSRRNWKRKKM